MKPTTNLTNAVAALDDAVTWVRDADREQEAPAAVLALCAMRLRDIRDVLTEWELQ